MTSMINRNVCMYVRMYVCMYVCMYRNYDKVSSSYPTAR